MSSNISSFLKSPHLSSRTRALLYERVELETKTPSHLSKKAYHILEILCEDILPQKSLLPDHQSINLAALIDHDLGKTRDGWRFAQLPSDQEAWEIGLRTLQAYANHFHHQCYYHLTSEERGHLLDSLYDTTLPDLSSKTTFSPSQMTLWYGDVRAEIVNAFLSHPLAQKTLHILSNFTEIDE